MVLHFIQMDVIRQITLRCIHYKGESSLVESIQKALMMYRGAI